MARNKLTLADLAQIPQQQLEQMPFDQLFQYRDNNPGMAYQTRLAPFEHRAFAREVVASNPLQALPMAMAVPAYQLKKLATPSMFQDPQMDTPASLAQFVQGMQGIGDGLKQWYRQKLVSGT